MLAWLQSVDNANLQLASVSLGEIQAGIERTREQNAAKASASESWLDSSAIAAPSCQWMDGPFGAGTS